MKEPFSITVSNKHVVFNDLDEVVNFSDSEVLINYKETKVHLIGNNLSIRELFMNTVYVSGNIQSIHFLNYD